MAYETLTMKTKVQCLFANEERGADVFQRKPFLVLTFWRCGTKGEEGGVNLDKWKRVSILILI